MIGKKENSFINKFIYSIKNFDKYPELAIKSWGEVLSYFIKLLLIFTLISSIAYTCKFIKEFNEISDEEYSSVMQLYGIETISKSEIMEYFNQTNSALLYAEIYGVIFVCLFVFNIINNLLYSAVLVILGYFATLFMRIRIRFNAMCKMVLHSLTLPIILNLIVIYVETFTTFRVKYFETMYIGIAFIYIVAAISMIRMDIIKNSQELQKILEEQKRLQEEQEKQEDENKKEENEENKKENKEKEDEDEDKVEDKNIDKDNDEPQEEGT